MTAAAPKPRAFCLMGPTASGKTALAAQLAQRFPLRIISVDSAMVYRGMDIGTGKPDAAMQARAPHRLIDIRDPATPYSVADFRQDSAREIAAAFAAGQLPLLVGGTMLYFKTLRDGLADLPAADAATRRKITALAAASGWEGVHARLAAVDPEAAGRIRPTDPQRLQRALEVFLLTGRPLTELQASSTPERWPWELEFHALWPSDRAALHRRIELRFHAMLEQGLVDEVLALRGRGDLHPNLPAIKSVGYRQVWDYLDGRLSRTAMVARAIAATRGLAKRQLTWLRQWQRQRGGGDDGLRVAECAWRGAAGLPRAPELTRALEQGLK